MSAELQTALVNEVMDLSNLFKQNCALKHGLPKPGDNRVSNLTIDPPPKPEPIKVDITNHIPAAPAAPNSPSPGAESARDAKSSIWRRAAPFLTSFAIGAAGPLAYAWYTGGADAVQTEAAKQKQSLLDALQNQGFHLDPERGAEWQTP